MPLSQDDLKVIKDSINQIVESKLSQLKPINPLDTVVPVSLADYVSLTVKANSQHTQVSNSTESAVNQMMPLLTLKMIGGIA